MRKRILTTILYISFIAIFATGCTINTSNTKTNDNEPKELEIVQTIVSSGITLPFANISQYGVGYYLAWDIEEFDKLHNANEEDICLKTDSYDQDGEMSYVRDTLDGSNRYGIWLNENEQYRKVGSYKLNLYVGQREFSHMAGKYQIYKCELKRTYEIKFEVEKLLLSKEEYMETRKEVTIYGDTHNINSEVIDPIEEQTWYSSTGLIDSEIKSIIENTIETDETAPYCRIPNSKGIVRGNDGNYWLEKDMLEGMSGTCEQEIRDRIISIISVHEVIIEFK